MPSASSKTTAMSNQVPSLDGQDPLKVVVSMMEKKVRNLEKRKTRLVSYTQQAEDGKAIEKDQEDAVKKLELVETNLELTKEFQQIFKQMDQEHARLQKKEQKRAKIEMKEKSMEERKQLVIRVLEVQTLLENLDGDVKEDFLKGTNGAVKLEEAELKNLDGIYKLITPSENEETDKMAEQISTAADHLQCLLDEKDKPVLDSTYKEVYGIIKKIKDSKYFEKSEEEAAPAEEATAQETQESEGTNQVEAAVVAPESQDVQVAEESHDAPPSAEVAVRGDEVYSEVPSDHAASSPAETQAPTEPSPIVNGVDLPSEFNEAVADPALNFMGESEVQAPAQTGEEGKLNAASPEFIPRGWQQGVTPQDTAAQSGSGWEESSEWQDVQQPHQSNRSRGGPRGRDRGGFRGGREGRGGRGRGGYGQNGPNYYRQDRQDHRRDGGRGGPRGGNQRGGRGGPRGSSRGGPPRGGSARGHHAPHAPQQQ